MKEQPLAGNGHGITKLQGQHSERCALDQLDITQKPGDTKSLSSHLEGIWLLLCPWGLRSYHSSQDRHCGMGRLDEPNFLGTHSSATHKSLQAHEGPYFLLFLILLLWITPPLDVNADRISTTCLLFWSCSSLVWFQSPMPAHISEPLPIYRLLLLSVACLLSVHINSIHPSLKSCPHISHHWYLSLLSLPNIYSLHQLGI